MQLMNEWHEIGSSKCDFRKELEHCTLRIARASSDSTEWIAEITVRHLMTGTIRQVYEAGSIDRAMEEAELLALDKFASLKGYYNRLLKELLY